MPHHRQSASRFGIWASTVVLAVSIGSIARGAGAPPSSDEQRFLVESNAAMATMMNAMQPRASGDVDRDFASMMIPHHQGAIVMAVSELRYGKNEQLRRIAQEIVADQTQEIAVMRMAIGDAPGAAATPPTHRGPTGMAGMSIRKMAS